MDREQTKPHVLYICKNNYSEHLFRRVLGESFHVTYCSTLPSEVLPLLSKHTFALVLLECSDVYDTENSGDSTTTERGWDIAEMDREILTMKPRTVNSATPILVAMTFDDGPLADQVRRLGATRVFRKVDFSPKTVVEAIRKEIGAP